MKRNLRQLEQNDQEYYQQDQFNQSQKDLFQNEIKKSSLRQSTINQSQGLIDGPFISQNGDEMGSEDNSSIYTTTRKKRKRSQKKSKAKKNNGNKIRINLPLPLSKLHQIMQQSHQSIKEEEAEQQQNHEENDIKIKSTYSNNDTKMLEGDNQFKIVIDKYESDTQEIFTNQSSKAIAFNPRLEASYSNEIKEFNKVINSPLIPPMLKTKTYINCDLRYFNYSAIRNRIGSFDVILCDPPWRIKGGQRNNTSFMFSNSSFKLNYNTLSYPDIYNIKVETLSDKGFCFLWVLNSLLNEGYKLLEKWGYEVKDQILWIKFRKDNLDKREAHCSNGYYFLHGYEICLVGYKCPQRDHVDFYSKKSPNLIWAETNKQSQKPEELYEKIEKMMPGSKKIELFARNNNLRDGWLSLGNQLGEEYLLCNQVLTCNKCHCDIVFMTKRYKSKKRGNYDICELCFNLLAVPVPVPVTTTDPEAVIDNDSRNDFFELNNNIDDNIYHEYVSCNKCLCEPIQGLRFKNKSSDYDLCELCYDQLSEGRYDYDCLELPELAHGIVVHYGINCKSCYQKPIIGTCIQCTKCVNYFLCQNCYFNSTTINHLHLNNENGHQLEVRQTPKLQLAIRTKCNGCNKVPIKHCDIYKCNNCYDYNLCEDCFYKRGLLSCIGTNHRLYHTFQCYKS